jgi:hypothetical protein
VARVVANAARTSLRESNQSTTDPVGTLDRRYAAPNTSRELHVKKGRHRRFEEARSLKRAFEIRAEPCPECGAGPEEEHASWCLHDSEEIEDESEDGQSPAF